MGRSYESLAGLLSLFLAAGCAHAPRTAVTEARNAPAEEVASGEPKLVGCTAYTPPEHPWDYPNRVWVQVTVDPNGQVRPGSATAIQGPHTKGGSVAVQRALQMAETCSFTPAQRDGQPVEGRASFDLAFR